MTGKAVWLARVCLLAALILVIQANTVRCAYVGSRESDVYHYATCRWAKEIYPENEVWFETVTHAKASGYRACKVCKPPP